MTRLMAWATAALIAMTPAVQAKDFALAYFMGPTHPLNKAVFTPFAEKLAEVSGGKLTVTQFPGGALNSSPPKQYSILLDGVADVVFHLPGYTAQLFPLATAVTTPGMCGDALDCTRAMWRAHDQIAAEFDAKVLAMWANDLPVLYTKDKPVKTLEDIQGMVIRVTSAQDIPFIEALGASAVSQPVSVVNQNLANGVVDGVTIDPSATMSFKLAEPANYITTNIPGAGSAFILLMNKGVWESLSDEEKGWVDAASGEWLSLEGGGIYARLASRGLEVAAEQGVEVYELPAEERARWDAAIAGALAEWEATEIAPGVTGADISALLKGE